MSDYGEQFAASYDAGRSLPEEATSEWMRAFDHYIQGRRDITIVDVGAGTGRFAFPLAEWFGARVIAVEPSAKMRSVALEKRATSGSVEIIDGDAAHIDAGDMAADAAVLSMVVHHIPDLEMAAHEIGRILKPGAYAFVRNAFSGRLDEVPWYEWFPEAKAVDEYRLPSADRVVEAFSSVGFRHVGMESVPQILAKTFDEFVDKIGSRSISTQKLITDDEFEAGMARMRAAAVHVVPNEPIIEPIDLLVLQRL